MLFNSVAYALFLPSVLVLFHALEARRARQLLLLAASYVFYGAWDWRFLGLILLSTVVDYLTARGMQVTERRRRSLLAVSILVNLGVLASFKYFDFFIESAVALASTVGIRANAPLLTVVLPVGISFYTFQTLAYTIDVYRGRIPAEHDPVVFGLYVAFFPQLVAGPIERAERLLPQLRSIQRADRSDRTRGIELILLGLFKKVAIADGVAPFVDRVFADPQQMSRTALTLGAIAFAVQIYGDFSGYTDIARGSARMFGVHLIENFRQPYLSRSISEFWRRWHISLSAWLKDYLYIPLGGSRGSTSVTVRNLMVTMLLGGLWHGASWTFVVWGGVHGLLLSGERLIGRERVAQRRGPLWIALTFGLITISWVPFRANSLEQSYQFIESLVLGTGTQGVSTPSLLVLIFGAAMTALLDATALREERLDPLGRSVAAVRGFGYATAIVLAVILSAGSSQAFLYFQF